MSGPRPPRPWVIHPRPSSHAHTYARSGHNARHHHGDVVHLAAEKLIPRLFGAEHKRRYAVPVFGALHGQARDAFGGIGQCRTGRLPDRGRGADGARTFVVTTAALGLLAFARPLPHTLDDLLVENVIEQAVGAQHQPVARLHRHGVDHRVGYAVGAARAQLVRAVEVVLLFLAAVDDLAAADEAHARVAQIHTLQPTPAVRGGDAVGRERHHARRTAADNAVAGHRLVQNGDDAALRVGAGRLDARPRQIGEAAGVQSWVDAQRRPPAHAIKHPRRPFAHKVRVLTAPIGLVSMRDERRPRLNVQQAQSPPGGQGGRRPHRTPRQPPHCGGPCGERHRTLGVRAREEAVLARHCRRRKRKGHRTRHDRTATDDAHQQRDAPTGAGNENRPRVF
eukprot:ctg_544.g310